MEILRAIAAIRNPLFDAMFSLITRLGEETFFLVFAIIILWCVNKREGYFVLLMGLFGIVANQFMKLWFKIPRPWVYDTSFEPVHSAIEEATGYSFPSGHTQNVSGTLGTFAAFNSKSRKITVISVILILLVAFSRMYLGVHTLQDVIVPLLMSLVIVLLFRPFFVDERRFERSMPFICDAAIVFSILYVLYVHSISPESADPENLASGLKNAYTLIGCIAGLLPVYYIDKKFIKFDTGAVWYVQIVKVAVGLGVVLLIKVALASPLVALFGNEYVARSVRYFLMVCFAGLLWPISFSYLKRIRISPLDRLGQKIADRFSRK